MTLTRYDRTANQDMSIGLQPSAQAIEDGAIDDSNPMHKRAEPSALVDEEDRADKLGREEVMSFPTDCPR